MNHVCEVIKTAAAFLCIVRCLIHFTIISFFISYILRFFEHECNICNLTRFLLLVTFTIGIEAFFSWGEILPNFANTVLRVTWYCILPMKISVKIVYTIMPSSCFILIRSNHDVSLHTAKLKHHLIRIRWNHGIFINWRLSYFNIWQTGHVKVHALLALFQHRNACVVNIRKECFAGDNVRRRNSQIT